MMLLQFLRANPQKNTPKPKIFMDETWKMEDGWLKMKSETGDISSAKTQFALVKTGILISCKGEKIVRCRGFGLKSSTKKQMKSNEIGISTEGTL